MISAKANDYAMTKIIIGDGWYAPAHGHCSIIQMEDGMLIPSSIAATLPTCYTNTTLAQHQNLTIQYQSPPT